MKLIISEKSLRIDRIEITYNQILNLASGFDFQCLKSISKCSENNIITVTRNKITIQIFKVGKKPEERIIIRHFKFFNGIEMLRGAVGVPAPFDQQRSVDGRGNGINFIPINAFDPAVVPDFFFRILPEMLEENCRTVFADMIYSHIGAIQQATSPETVAYPTPNKRSLSINAIEGGVDVVVPSGFDLLSDYNFLENLASLGKLAKPKWETDKTHGEPKDGAPKDCWILRGNLYRFRTPFVIYVKDKNHKDYWQVRFELRPPGRVISKVLGSKLFLLDGDDKRLTAMFQNYLLNFVLPAARTLFEIDYPAMPKAQRDQLILKDLSSIPTRAGRPLTSTQVDAIAENLFKNNLLITLSDFHTGVREGIKKSDVFLPTARPGVYSYNRRRLFPQVQP